jgi:predicted secreted protein
MRRDAVKAALARLGASLVAIFLLALPAHAAERALIDFIGFSEDARYFAFEEFGIGDGSGAAYATIYVIDLNEDKWVTGSPFAIDTLDDVDPEARPLFDVRAEVLALAQPMLTELGITEPAQIVALNGDGEHEDRTTLSWWTPRCCGIDETEESEFKLTLSEQAAKGADNCQDTYAEGMDVVGYTLEVDGDGEHRVLHADGEMLPASRRCTLGYSIYGVVQPMDSTYGRVAIIASWPFGFEGPDRRFLAAPIDTP